MNMAKDFSKLYRLLPADLIIPLQESLNASLPPQSSISDATHQPFPANPPTFQSQFMFDHVDFICADCASAEFFEEIEIMRSLAKPRKISLQGSNGKIYTFLGKPKDDLRKDARLMDLYTLMNKLLKSNSDSRRRQLRKHSPFFHPFSLTYIWQTSVRMALWPWMKSAVSFNGFQIRYR